MESIEKLDICWLLNVCLQCIALHCIWWANSNAIFRTMPRFWILNYTKFNLVSYRLTSYRSVLMKELIFGWKMVLSVNSGLVGLSSVCLPVRTYANMCEWCNKGKGKNRGMIIFRMQFESVDFLRMSHGLLMIS